MKSGRLIRRVATLTVMFTVATAGVLLAHATLRRSDPPNGGHVTLPPPRLRLEFSETVGPRTSRVELVAPDSQRFALHVTGDSAMANVLVAHVPELRVAGQYRVEWRLVGPDGHAVTGKYRFTVDSIPVAIDTAVTTPADQDVMHEPPSDTLTQQAIRFASSLALVTVIGSVAFALFVLPAVSSGAAGEPITLRDPIDRRLRSLGAVGAWSLLALAVVRLVSHGATLSGSAASLSIGDLGDLVTGSMFGRGWLLQVVAAIAVLLALRMTGPVRWRVLAGITVALAISAALLGHPVAVTDVPVLAVSLDAVHALAAGGWAGAILVMTIGALPQVVRAPDHRLLLARNMLRAFSPLALTCAAVLVLTGAASAWLQLRDLGLVFGSAYGLALVRKVVVVLMIAALGAYHWRVAQPSLDTERSVARLRMSIALDVMLVVLVLILTAILTGTTPPVT